MSSAQKGISNQMNNARNVLFAKRISQTVVPVARTRSRPKMHCNKTANKREWTKTDKYLCTAAIQNRRLCWMWFVKHKNSTFFVAAYRKWRGQLCQKNDAGCLKCWNAWMRLIASFKWQVTMTSLLERSRADRRWCSISIHSKPYESFAIPII